MAASVPDQCGATGEGQRPSTTRSLWKRLKGNAFARDLAFVLVLKVALIFALYWFLFRPAMHPAHGPDATAAAVAGASRDTEVRQ
jgi:hypothetical protein